MKLAKILSLLLTVLVLAVTTLVALAQPPAKKPEPTSYCVDEETWTRLGQGFVLYAPCKNLKKIYRDV